MLIDVMRLVWVHGEGSWFMREKVQNRWFKVNKDNVARMIILGIEAQYRSLNVRGITRNKAL